MKTKVTAIIERASDGGYAIYTLESFEKFGVFGYGSSAEDAIEDFFVAVEEFKELLGDEVPEMDVTFKYDTVSFLQEYHAKFGLLGLHIITGISKRLLQQYVSGQCKPTAKTAKKIEQAIHEYADKLKEIQLA